MESQNSGVPEQAGDLQARIVKIHDDLVASYDSRLADQYGLFGQDDIRGFITKCFSELHDLGCCAIVYERESIENMVMGETPILRIVVPHDHPGAKADDLTGAYAVYRRAISALFDGKGDLFRLRKITNPGWSSGPETQTGRTAARVTGAYCMPFWIGRRKSYLDLFTLLLTRHFERNKAVHCLPWSAAELGARTEECRNEFETRLIELYMPNAPAEPHQKSNIFYYPSYNKKSLESHMLFAFTGLDQAAFQMLERLCSRIAYLIRKATADDLTYRVSAGSVAARTMCRNFAHNFGSHALFYVSWDSKQVQNADVWPEAGLTDLMTRLQEGETLTSAQLIALLNTAALKIREDFNRQGEYYGDLLALIDFVRDRGTYQAQVGNTASFWTLNYDLVEQLEGFKKIRLLTKNLCRSELGPDRLDVRVENVPSGRSALAAMSMGRVGVQALYSIIENIAKNTAKYTKGSDSQELVISIFLEDDSRYPNDHRISVESNRKQDQEVVDELEEYLEDINFDNSKAEYERLGLAEILVSASVLRRIKPYVIKRYLKQSIPEKPRLLEISLSDRAGPTSGSVRYVFFIPKPNLALIVSDSEELQKSFQGLGETIAAKDGESFTKLVTGFSQRIPRHDFLVIDEALDKLAEKPPREWLTEHAAYLPSRWVYATVAEMLDWISSAEDRSGRVDERHFARLAWDRYFSRVNTVDTYIVDSRFKSETVIELPSFHTRDRMAPQKRRVVLSGSAQGVPPGSIVFLHEYAERRREFTQGGRSDESRRAASNDSPKPGGRSYRFVEAIRDAGWTKPMHEEVLRIPRRCDESMGSSELDDASLLALYRCIEAANAHVVVVDERVDQEMSRLSISSKAGEECFDDFWAQRNVFRIPHQEFVARGDLRLRDYQKGRRDGNAPSFVFLHLSLIQQWMREHSDDEERFRNRAKRWSRAGVKFIIHSDRGNHDLTGKWKASTATFESLGGALMAGDKLALLELALAARAPSVERT